MRNKRKALVAVLSVFALSSAGAALMTGCNATVGRIDAPTELEADLGTYVIPDYDVVDDNGMILAGYNVYLKSATDADGGELSINYGSVTVETAGIYKFVYSAGSKKVSDVTVSIDFADRTAPVINYDDRELPEFFIRGNSYKMPAYTLSGDYVREKCWSKVYYIDGNENETEVKIESGRFLVDKTDGSYAIRIHVEDAVGNANDYEYVRKVDGPETLVENRVLYFNEAFGERQVSCYDSAYKGEFVTDLPKVEGNAADPKEGGAYKVTFDGVTQTRYNEGCISMNVPAVINLYEYEYLEMWVYNDSEQDIVMGSMWWNDTKIEKGKWNKIVWSTREWGGRDGNKDATNTKFVDVTDISKMTIRFLFDYDQKVVPNGTFYLSSMNAIPKVAAKITEAECATEGGGVTFDQDKYFVNDTVNLSAKKVAGKVVDCYKVDGEVIAGSSFTVTSTAHTVEAVYADDPLTLENMTWATPACGTLSGDSARYYKLGEGKNWVLKYDVYDIGASGWNYLAAYVGGTNQLLGFELVNDGGKFCGYGGSYKWGDGVTLSADTVALIRGATAEKPLTVTYIREGNFVKTFIEYDGVSHFIATVDIVNTLGCTSGNSFGIGGRAEPTNATVHNIRVIESSAKTALVHATYGAKVVKGDDVTDFTNKDYRIGDTVILSAPKEKDGKLFLCFKVGNNNISGNSFVITQESVTVSAVYTDPCTITLGEGLSVDGKTGSVTVASGTVIEVKYGGTAPAGKYFEGVFIGGNPYSGGSITVTADIEVTVKYEDRIANDNEKLNDISAAAEAGGIVYTNNSSYNPSGVEYVTDFGYNGADGTVDADNSLKVTLSGSEQGFSLDNGIQNLDIYSEIYFYAYTECNVPIYAGGWWCRDTVLVPGKWTKVSFGRDKQPQNVSQQSVWEHGIKQFIYSFTKQWQGTDIPAGTVVYVTAVYGVPYEETSAIEFKNGTASADGRQTYGKGETVNLVYTGTAPQGQFFDCFAVDGVKLNGSSFTAEKASYEVTPVFASSVENMTWATPESGTPTGDDAQAYRLDSGENWVLRYEVYDIGASGWNYLAAYVGGTNQLLGFELVNNSGKFCGYGGGYKWGDGVALSAETVALMRGATAEKPLTVTYIRNGNFVKTFIEYDGAMQHVATVDIVNTLGCTSGNDFGIGGRKGPTNATTHNIRYVTGAIKTKAYLELTNMINTASGLDGSLATYTDGTYTVPEATVVDLLGNTVNKPVTVTVKDALNNALTVTGGKVTLPAYGGSQFITITYSADGCRPASVKVNLQKSDSNVLMQASELGAANIDAYGNTVAYSTERAYGEEAGSIKVTLNSSETAIKFNKTDFGNYRYIEFYIYTADANVQTGAWWNQDAPLTQNDWEKVKIDLQYNGIDTNGGAFPLRLGGTWNGTTNSANNVKGAVVYISSVTLLAE